MDVFKKHTAKSSFKRSLPDLNVEFSFSYTGFHAQIKEPSLSKYFSIAGERIIDCMILQRAFLLCGIRTLFNETYLYIYIYIYIQKRAFYF